MRDLRKAPATLLLLMINVTAFAGLWIDIGTLEGPEWVRGLLLQGAQFAPLSLDTQWYRLFTHMFMHGGVVHLIMNMYALFIVGTEVENLTGTGKFLLIYFVTGLCASIASLYFSLFMIGVGASGAIFGLFGFSLAIQVKENYTEPQRLTPILINFVIFMVINLLFAKQLNADTPAHLGGLAGGILMGVASIGQTSYTRIRGELVVVALSIALLLALPRYQVTYYQFFQRLLDMEDETNALLSRKGYSDDEYLRDFKQQATQWDTVQSLLDAHDYLPEPLLSDTAKLRQYIRLKQLENSFRIAMIERESFRYLDSIEWAQQQIVERQLTQLDYPLTMMRPMASSDNPSPTPTPQLERVQVWYDKDWVQVEGSNGEYYRIGQRDSLGRWQGFVRDFYKDGTVQMKGAYKDDLRHGIFLFYSDHNTYTSAGRFNEERAVGKWEYFYDDGRLRSEEVYADGNYLNNMWDENGRQIVTDGEGQWITYYDNGVVSETGAIVGGKREGLWKGYHENGKPYFEEYYRRGRMLNGQSVDENGQRYVYDNTSEFPIPVGGNEAIVRHLQAEVKKLNPSVHGRVHMAFRVTVEGVLTDFLLDEKLTPELDQLAIEIVKRGPAWIPAKVHGHEKVEGWARVTVNF